MLILKIILTIICFNLCVNVVNHPYFQVPDTNFEQFTCSPENGGYRISQSFIPVEGITPKSEKIMCWYYCYLNGCFAQIDQPMTYGFLARLVTTIIIALNMFFIYQF